MPTINREFYRRHPERKKKKEKKDKKKSPGSQYCYDTVYKTEEWRKLRIDKLMYQPLCEKCLERDIVKQALDVHHIIPILEDPTKAFDMGNLMSLCRRCHLEEHKRLNAEKKRKEQEELEELIRIQNNQGQYEELHRRNKN